MSSHILQQSNTENIRVKTSESRKKIFLHGREKTQKTRRIHTGKPTAILSSAISFVPGCRFTFSLKVNFLSFLAPKADPTSNKQSSHQMRKFSVMNSYFPKKSNYDVIIPVSCPFTKT